MSRPDDSIETNDEEKAEIISNQFRTIYTREVGLPSHTQNVKIEYVQALFNDVKTILKSLKKTIPRARIAFHQSF